MKRFGRADQLQPQRGGLHRQRGTAHHLTHRHTDNRGGGHHVKILASPWTAPAEYKTNNSRINGGSLKTDDYDDYANHLNSYVQYMKNQGVTIDVTSVQNEPDWAPAYDSMTWTGDQLQTFVRDQGAEVQNTKLMVAEAVNLNYSYADPTLNDATARNNIGYIGGHLYGTESAGRLAPIHWPRSTTSRSG